MHYYLVAWTAGDDSGTANSMLAVPSSFGENTRARQRLRRLADGLSSFCDETARRAEAGTHLICVALAVRASMKTRPRLVGTYASDVEEQLLGDDVNSPIRTPHVTNIFISRQPAKKKVASQHAVGDTDTNTNRILPHQVLACGVAVVSRDVRRSTSAKAWVASYSYSYAAESRPPAGIEASRSNLH
ncbi:hypothetical protein CSOJ01_00874 [Colletotrichum sojae]|uniref:Uncharacterized protein n=1 Tax=Colletotrichum sojae TaxID=2175907 RepID=A0A8H6N5G0_9PEZI|nr:hypothetical protein CSOJ01_00874 [Colletotrichum sojae]